MKKIKDELKVNYVILHLSPDSFFAKQMMESGIRVEGIYKNTNIISRKLRSIFFKKKYSTSLWHNKNIDISPETTIIIFDSGVDISYLKFIADKFKVNRKIFWYWNPIRHRISPNLISKLGYEAWTYSISDSEKYNININTTFYFREIVKQEKKSNNIEYIKNDVLFVGRDKNRLNELQNIEKNMKNMGLITYFYITADSKLDQLKRKNFRPLLSYTQIIKLILKSNSILDIVQNKYDGLSLRAMESLFFNKKLITNNVTIKYYDFYNKKNIFILNEDNIEELPNFLKSSYEKIDKKIVDSYDFSKWIQRF